MTLVGRHCPWVESFMLGNFLAATRLTRELDATLPIVSFLVEFVAYSGERTTTYDWHEFLPPDTPLKHPRCGRGRRSCSRRVQPRFSPRTASQPR